jgi:tryptophan synthase alpha chain
VSGIERIAEAFASARAEGRRAALMPYMMGGFPDLERSRAVGAAYVRAGADLVELGIPFSDPLADGPVIHAAAVRALAAGVRVHDVLALGAELAREVPVVVMCYVNPILALGLERFADLLAGAGVSGLIVPDLPLEESAAARACCERRGLALIPLAAPTTPDERLRRIGASARGFLYAVSVTGTTGERAALDEALGRLLARARAATAVPVCAGFGIGTPAQAASAAAAGADGVIVGSRLVRAAGEASAAGELARELELLLGGFAAALREEERLPLA